MPLSSLRRIPCVVTLLVLHSLANRADAQLTELRELLLPGGSPRSSTLENSGDAGGADPLPAPTRQSPIVRASEVGRSLESVPGANKMLAEISFNAVPLAEAIAVLNEQTDLNVLASAEAGKVPVTANLKNLSVASALEAIVNANGLFYRVDPKSGVVHVATAKEYERDLASFRNEETRVFTLLYPNPQAVAQVIQQVFGPRVQYIPADADFTDFIDLSQRFNRFDLVDGRSLGLGTFEGGGQGGGGRGGMGMGGMGMGMGGMGMGMGGMGMGGLGMGMGGMGMGGLGMGMGGMGMGMGGMGMGGLSQRSRNRGNLGGLATGDGERLNDLTAAEIQQLENQLAAAGDISEAERSALLERRQATIFVSSIRRNNQVVVRTGDSRTMAQIADLITQLDVPTPTVLLEVKVLRVVLADGFNSAFEFFGGTNSSAVGFSDGALLPPFPGGSPASRTLPAGLGVSGRIPGSLTFQVINDDFQLRLQLLESKNRVTALATPLILTANNEVSRIFVGDTLPFTVGFTPAQIVGGINAVAGAVAATPITELRDVGQSLLITPNINADRSVTLRIVEENSERITNGASIPVPSTDGTDVNTVSIDTVRRRTVSGTVVAQDGMAVALGGLIEEGVSDTRDQIPVLGNIPKIGFLFRRQATSRQRTELIVVIRPYVFNTPSEASATSQCVLSTLTLHPNGPDPVGTMNTYLPCEVIRPDPDCLRRANLLRFHNVVPAVY